MHLGYFLHGTGVLVVGLFGMALSLALSLGSGDYRI